MASPSPQPGGQDTAGSLVMLEHVNITVGEVWTQQMDDFWFQVLGAARDSRPAGVVKRMYGDSPGRDLHWANLGLQQVHLPCQPAGLYEGLPGLETWKLGQRIRGVVGLEWAEEDFPALLSRLRAAENTTVFSLVEGEGSVEFREGLGNRFRVTSVPGKPQLVGPCWPLPRDTTCPLPGGKGLGLGIRYIQYFTPPGVLASVAQQYREVLGARVTLGDRGGAVQVMIGVPGNQQYLLFTEEEQVGEYEGDHLAVYVRDFLAMYRRARQANIVWNNPCFPALTYDTEELALACNEFRFKDFLEQETGKVVYQLEHEVRSLQHPSFLQHGDTFSSLGGQ